MHILLLAICVLPTAFGQYQSAQGQRPFYVIQKDEAVNSYGCPDGYDHIYAQWECQAAADYLHLGGSTPVETDSDKDEPIGCFQKTQDDDESHDKDNGSLVLFNVWGFGNPTPIRPNRLAICKIKDAKYAQNSRGHGYYCPSGYEHITTQEECKAAVDYMNPGKNLQVHPTNDMKDPIGCFGYTSDYVRNMRRAKKTAWLHSALPDYHGNGMQDKVVYTAFYNAKGQGMKTQSYDARKLGNFAICKRITSSPTKFPTKSPTSAPTKMPTDAPTKMPTETPTSAPTKMPTESPTSAPTKMPTKIPTTSDPSNMPTKSP